MKVVCNSEGARMAGVTRQAINDLKRINIEHKGRYPFFVFNPLTGKPGINIEHKEWLNYLDRNQSIRVKKKATKQMTESKVAMDEYGNPDRVKDFVILCLTVGKKYMNQNNYNDFKNEISVEYKRVNKK